jgi:hypothetical protein
MMAEATERTLQLLRFEMGVAWFCYVMSTITLVARWEVSICALIPPAILFSPSNTLAKVPATGTCGTRDTMVDRGPRLYSRIYLLRQFGLDDMLAVAAVVSSKAFPPSLNFCLALPSCAPLPSRAVFLAYYL